MQHLTEIRACCLQPRQSKQIQLLGHQPSGGLLQTCLQAQNLCVTLAKGNLPQPATLPWFACRFQKIVQLPAKQRGCHIITRNLLQELPELAEYEVGMANLFGASLVHKHFAQQLML